MLDFSFLSNNPGDILISNSGGPDCAIVFYGAAKYVVENNLSIKFYHATIDSQTKFFYIKHAKQVIDFVEQEFGIPCEKHFTIDNVEVGQSPEGVCTNYKETQIELFDKIFAENSNIKYLLSGGSNMLPKEFLLEEQAKGNWLNAELQADPNRHNSKPFNPFSFYFDTNGKSVGRYYGPFVNGDKRNAKQCYDYYDVTNTLFPLTRSCESSSESGFYNGQEHCGECLFCFERYTVFGRL